MEAFDRIFVVLHNVQSPNRVVEMAKIVYGLGFPNFIVTKAVGSAAQIGVPEAQKIALKHGYNFVFLRDLSDLLEVLEPKTVLMFTPKIPESSPFEPEEVRRKAERGEKVALVFGGLEPGLTKRELELGKPVHLMEEASSSVLASVAIALYLIKTH